VLRTVVICGPPPVLVAASLGKGVRTLKTGGLPVTAPLRWRSATGARAGLVEIRRSAALSHTMGYGLADEVIGDPVRGPESGTPA
jgi:hypothetical protein